MSPASDAVRARRLPDLSPDVIESRLDAIVDDFPAPSDRDVPLLIVPDAHHPYHPSTGLVTSARVADALVGCLQDRGWAPRIAVTDADTARYLGIEAVAHERDASLVDLVDAPRTEVVVEKDGESTEVALPEPLARHPVVTVPTLRRDEDGTGDRPAGVVARCSAVVQPATRSIEVRPAASIAAVDPIGSVIDATYTAGETPAASKFLLASTDSMALDAVAADLLGVEPPEGTADPAVADTSIHALRRQVAAGMPQGTEPHPLLAVGYRLYARIVGDAIPPQFQPESNGEPEGVADGHAD